MKKSSMRASLRAQVKLVSLKLLRAPYISDYLQVRSVLENAEELHLAKKYQNQNDLSVAGYSSVLTSINKP